MKVNQTLRKPEVPCSNHGRLTYSRGITMTIKNNDFIEIEYDAYTEDNELFDTTSKEKAEESGQYNPRAKYGPVVICVGQGHVIKGIDEALIGKDIPTQFSMTLPPEVAFGKKNPKLLKLINKSFFTANKINPVPSLLVNIDGMNGKVKTVSGGRIMVDFNHPLSGLNVRYDVKVNREVKDNKEKVNAFLDLLLNIKAEKIVEEEKAIKVEIKANINQELLNNLAKEISKIIGKDVSIVVTK